MEDSAQNNFAVFLLGLGTMVTFHNTILSSKKFISRNYGKVSDMLRIICNFGNLWRFLLSLGYFITPSNVTSASCEALGYLYLIGYHLFHVSLCAFLLWTLYRMSYKKKDLWIGIVFLLVQTALIIPEMIFARSKSVLSEFKMTHFTDNELYPETYHCELTSFTDKFRLWTMIIMGFLMVFYVVVRFAYLTKNRKRVAAGVSTCGAADDNNNNSTTNVVAARRPLRLSVVYWTLILSMLSFMLVWISSSLDERPDKLMSISIFGLIYKNFLYILISYVITYMDSEKRKDVIFYNCGGQSNNVNKLDGEAWVICSKKDKKKDADEEKETNDASTQAQV